MNMLMGGGISSRNDAGDRTSSFSNLADVLGNDLVESMEDAMQDKANNNSVFASKNEPLSFHRMKRHAANRLMGPSPPNHDDFSNINNGSSRGSSFVPPVAASAEKEASTQSADPPELPWNLYIPQSESMDEKEQAARRSTTPVQMFPGHQSGGQRRSHPVSNKIGTNIMEPEEDSQFSKFAGIVSQRIDHRHPPMHSDPTVGSDSNRSMHELERGVQNMWSPEAREFKPSSMVDVSHGGGRSVNSTTSEKTEVSSRHAESDLQPYLWRTDSTQASRCLAILHVSWLRVPDIRSACERFGVLESFRADFASRGIFFLSYYDIRSAQYAAGELQSILQRLSVMQGSNEEVVVRYCLSLSSSSQFDECRIVISNLPHSINEYALKSILSSYGALLSVVYQEDGSYVAEFHNLQDTKQALLELDSAQPWGPDAVVEVSVRNGMERKRGRELLALIGRWRHGMIRVENGPAAMSNSSEFQRTEQHGRHPDNWGRNPNPSFQAQTMDPRPQFVLGPDGRYTQMMIHSHHPPGYDQSHQQYIQGPNGQVYVAAMPQHQDTHSYGSQRSPHHTTSPPYERRIQQNHTPYYAHVVTSDANSLSGRSLRSGHSQGTDGGDKDNRHLMMDLDLVEIGHDTRTSLMVRNIPNKYTQQMLLSEFEANGHGPGVIDFFYLPIDFKNRCNRGYAFINFVDPMDILAFHRRYYGKHWRTFNSDKICDITYARIQGKDAMLKRFENSALMEKDDEYKPLVFASDGPAKGTRLPFPDPSLHANRVGRAEV
jgi:RNA recognition motif 2